MQGNQLVCFFFYLLQHLVNLGQHLINVVLFLEIFIKSKIPAAFLVNPHLSLFKHFFNSIINFMYLSLYLGKKLLLLLVVLMKHFCLLFSLEGSSNLLVELKLQSALGVKETLELVSLLIYPACKLLRKPVHVKSIQD